MNAHRLQISHLDKKLSLLYQFGRQRIPVIGWVQTIRQALNMTQTQLGLKMGLSRQGLQQLEARERSGGITISTLREFAQVMDMDLVYGFIPRDGSLEGLVRRRAQEYAEAIVRRTSVSMALEDQGVSEQRIRESVAEYTEAFLREIPRELWD